MLHLLHASMAVYSSIRDAFIETIEDTRAVDPMYASFAGVQMHYYSSRCQSTNILLQEWKLWDSDILMRSALECATRFLFVSVANGGERHLRIGEYAVLLNEIQDIKRSEKAKVATKNAVTADSRMLFGGAILDATKEAELREKWPRSKHKSLQQKWSFSEIARALEKINEPALNLSSYGSLLHSYGISSHLIHADQTAMDLMYDRASRDEEERVLLERAHFARLASGQTELFFLCWRAMEHATGSTKKHESIVRSLLDLCDEANKYHLEFASSQTHRYDPSVGQDARNECEAVSRVGIERMNLLPESMEELWNAAPDPARDY